jgi:hypothetical protein
VSIFGVRYTSEDNIYLGEEDDQDGENLVPQLDSQSEEGIPFGLFKDHAGCDAANSQ